MTPVESQKFAWHHIMKLWTPTYTILDLSHLRPPAYARPPAGSSFRSPTPPAARYARPHPKKKFDEEKI